MTLKEKKERMLNFRDLAGFDFTATDVIKSAKTNSDLDRVLNDHISWLEDHLADTISSVEHLRNELKLWE